MKTLKEQIVLVPVNIDFKQLFSDRNHKDINPKWWCPQNDQTFVKNLAAFAAKICNVCLTILWILGIIGLIQLSKSFTQSQP